MRLLRSLANLSGKPRDPSQFGPRYPVQVVKALRKLNFVSIRRHILCHNSACIPQIAVMEAMLSKWALVDNRTVKVVFLLAREGSARNSLRGKTA
jgi:hypothetical protein